MTFGWCLDERPYPDEEMEEMTAKIAKLIEAGDELADRLSSLVADDAWSVTRESWQEAKRDG